MKRQGPKLRRQDLGGLVPAQSRFPASLLPNQLVLSVFIQVSIAIAPVIADPVGVDIGVQAGPDSINPPGAGSARVAGGGINDDVTPPAAGRTDGFSGFQEPDPGLEAESQ